MDKYSNRTYTKGEEYIEHVTIRHTCVKVCTSHVLCVFMCVCVVVLSCCTKLTSLAGETLGQICRDWILARKGLTNLLVANTDLYWTNILVQQNTAYLSNSPTNVPSTIIHFT